MFAGHTHECRVLTQPNVCHEITSILTFSPRASTASQQRSALCNSSASSPQVPPSELSFIMRASMHTEQHTTLDGHGICISETHLLHRHSTQHAQTAVDTRRMHYCSTRLREHAKVALRCTHRVLFFLGRIYYSNDGQKRCFIFVLGREVLAIFHPLHQSERPRKGVDCRNIL